MNGQLSSWSERNRHLMIKPSDCPNCYGQREWKILGKIATCFFCGREGA